VPTPGEPLNLDKPSEWTGLWWLPGRPDDQVPGVLRYDPATGLRLSLIGVLEDRVMAHPSPDVTLVHEGTQSWEILHGAAEQREVTLLGCVPVRSKRTMGARVKSPDQQTVEATTAVIGMHLSGHEEDTLGAAEVSVEDLLYWSAESAFEVSLGLSEGKLNGAGNVSVKPIDDRSVVVGGTEFRLRHEHILPFLDETRGETVARVRETAFVRIVPAEVFSLSDALEQARLIQDLISLATHRAAGLIWVRVLSADSDVDRPADGTQRAVQRPAYVISRTLERGARTTKPVVRRDAFFTCETYAFEEVVPRWCETHSRLQAAANMILGLRYAPPAFVENNLLTVAGAAEVLHRELRIDNPPFPRGEFRAMRDAMLARVSEEHRDRFRGAIRNDPTLHDRLCALAARPDQEAIALLMPSVERWASRTTRARNDLTHEGKTPRHSFDELVAVVHVTTVVVVLNLLHELGLPAKEQCRIMRENPQFRAAAMAARNWLSDPAPDS
jgi:hypothetical protein